MVRKAVDIKTKPANMIRSSILNKIFALKERIKKAIDKNKITKLFNKNIPMGMNFVNPKRTIIRPIERLTENKIISVIRHEYLKRKRIKNPGRKK
jgi:hypothetical protein